MLTTKAFCGKCGAMVSGESGKSHTGTVHYYYKCRNHKRNGRAACDLQVVRKEPLELFVVKAAVQKVLQPKVMDRLCDLLLAYQKQENTRLPLLQKQLQEVKKKIGNLIAAIEQGILTPSTKQRMDELEQQRQHWKPVFCRSRSKNRPSHGSKFYSGLTTSVTVIRKTRRFNNRSLIALSMRCTCLTTKLSLSLTTKRVTSWSPSKK